MRRLCAMVLTAVTLLTWPVVGVQAGGAPPAVHWALSAAKTLPVNWPADLDQAIGFKEWYVLLNRVLGREDLPSPGEIRLTISRQEAVAGLLEDIRFIKAPDQTPLLAFVDGSEVGEGYRGAMATAIQLGLVKGYPGGELRPGSHLTHGEAAALLERAVRILGNQWKPAPEPPQRPPVDLGFGEGLTPPVPFKPEGLLPGRQPWAGGGPLGLVVHGIAYTSDLPVVGTAPDGYRWVVMDLEVVNGSETENLSLTNGIEITLEDGPGTNAVLPDAAGTAALGSPFAVPGATVPPGSRARGLVAFAVADGRKQIWFSVKSSLGLSQGKQGWNSVIRGLAGDLPDAQQ